MGVSYPTPPFLVLASCNASAPSPWTPAKNISVAERWVIVNTEDMLWILADYQSSCIAVHESCVAFGYRSGKILLLQIQ